MLEAGVTPTTRDSLSTFETVHNVIAVRGTAKCLREVDVDESTEFDAFEIAVRGDRGVVAGVVTAISSLNPTSIRVLARDRNGSNSLRVETTEGPIVLVLSTAHSDVERVPERRFGRGILSMPVRGSIPIEVDVGCEDHMEKAGPPGKLIETLFYAAVHSRAVDATLSEWHAGL